MSKSPITMHIRDTAQGKPAVRVRLQRLNANVPSAFLGEGITDTDGRNTNLLPAETP